MNAFIEDNDGEQEQPSTGELLDEYLIAQESGKPVTPEALCEELGGSLESLRLAIARHRRFESLKQATHFPLPTVYGAYDVVEELDAGGCGTVFRCRHKHLQREAAVKVVVLSENNPLAEAHFVREVEVVRQFGHDRIATIFDSGVLDHGSISVGWLAMEYLPGGRIDEYVSRTSADTMQILLLFRSVVATLLDAHRSGILHHDLKPGNILMSKDGKPHLTDFGLARIAGSKQSVPRPDSPLGTPGYMAPELKDGRSIPNVTSEIYSLGVLLSRLLNGQAEATGSTPQVSAGEKTPYNDLSRSQSRDLDAVLARMTATEPANRYSSLTRLLSEIDCVIDGQVVEARPVSPVERGYRWARRYPSMAVLGAVATATVTIAFVLLAVHLTSKYRHAREIDERNRELIAREIQLERATVSSRLRSIQALSKQNRTLAKQALEDESLFPPPLRGFAWNYLQAEATVAVHELSDLEGGFGGIHQIKFSPDSRKLVVCSKPKCLSLIDLSNRTRTILPHEVRLAGTVLSHPGMNAFFCQQSDGCLLEVAWETGETIRRIELPKGTRAKLALTSIGDKIYGLTKEGRPFQLELASETIKIGADPIEVAPAGLWLTPDDQVLHCVTRHGVWRQWNADSLTISHSQNVLDLVPAVFWQKQLSDIKIRAAQACYEMDFGLCIALGFSNGLSTVVWPDSTRTYSVIARSSLLTNHFAFRPRSQCVIPDGKGGLLFSVFDSLDQETIGLVTDSVIAAAISTDNRWVSTGGSKGKLFVRQIPDRNERTKQLTTFPGEDLGFGSPVRTLPLRASGETLVCHREGWCAVINANTNQLLEGFQVSESQFSTVTHSPKHQLVVLGFRTPASRIVGLKVLDSGRFGTHDGAPDQVSELHFDKGRSPQPTFEVKCDANVTSMCFTKNQDLLLVALRNGEIFTIDVASGKVVQRWNQFTESSASLSMTAVEDGILCGGADGQIRLFDVSTGIVKQSWQAGKSRVYALTPSHDESQVIAGMASGSIRVFDRQGSLVHQMSGHDGRVLSLALSSDGGTLASGSADHSIAIWDAHTGDMQLHLKRHTDAVTDLHFTADNSELRSTSVDGAIYVWHTEDPSDASFHHRPSARAL